MKRVLTLGLLALLIACEDAKSERLAAAQAEREHVLKRFQRLAEKSEDLRLSSAKVRADVEKELARYGLNQKPEALEAVLRDRAKKTPGASLEKAEGSNRGLAETGMAIWELRYPAKNLAAAFKLAQDFSSVPPLFRFSSLVPSLKKPGLWKLQLTQAEVERTTIDPKVQPIAKLPAPFRPSQGWFGHEPEAGLEQIRELDAELAKLKPVVDELSVLLPTEASWLGIKNRSDRLLREEFESRRILELLVQAASAKKLSVNAVAASEEVVLLDFPEDSPALAEFEKALPPDLLEGMTRTQLESGERRWIFPNRVRTPKQAEETGPLGLPMPDKLKEAFEKAHHDGHEDHEAHENHDGHEGHEGHAH